MRNTLHFLLAVCLGALLVVGQAPVGGISGLVSDPNSAVIAGAAVTVTSAATAATRTASTDETGFFLIANLQPGEYKLTIQSKGFATYEADRVVVEVGQTVRVNAQLKLATSVQQVQVVEAGIVAVDTARATIEGVVTTRQINELPLNGRNYLELARLQPGVEIQEGRSFDPTKSRYTGVSIGSRNGREARITIDGVDAVDEHVGTTTINISQDSIQEFQVSTSSADPSTGLSATGGINVITRRGSNDVHGSGFAFGRGSRYAARPSFAAQKPDFDRNQWGFHAGGRFIKDKLFWFANFEKTQENSAIGVATAYFPSVTSFAGPFDERSSTVRVDYRLPKSNDLFFRWSRNDNNSFGGFGGNKMPSGGNFNTNTAHQYVAGWDAAFSSRISNSFRAAATDFKNRVLAPPDSVRSLHVPGAEGIRIITDDGLLNSGPDNITPQSTFELFGQWRDDVTYSTGRHTVRGGFDIVKRRVRVTNFVFGFPSITVVSPASRNAADILNQPIVDFSIGNKNGKRIPGTPDNSHRNTRFAWYVAENWRLRPNLTLNFGLRYEVDTMPLNNDLQKAAILKPILPRGTDPTPIDTNNFSPTVGIAWDPTGSGKTSVRLGGGIYYALRVSNLVTNERASIAPFNSGNDTITKTRGTAGAVDFNRDGKPDFDFTAALATGATVKQVIPIILAGQAVYVAAPPSTIPTIDITRTGTIISNQLSTPYSAQVNAGVQRELPWNSVIDVNFIYSRTSHEFMRDVDAANLFPGNGAPITLGDGAPPNGAITLVTSDGFSRYRALTAKYDKRFAKRYQLTAAYALSKLETTTADGLGLGGGALVNRNTKANFGTGPFDRKHRLTLNGIVELPYQFRASMIATFNSAVPATALVPADINGDGISGDLLSGTRRGYLGREITNADQLNTQIRSYNQTLGGRLNLRGQRLPFVLELPGSIGFGDSFMSQDFQVSKTFKIRERYKLEFTAQMFNLFNISNLVGSAGLPSTPFTGTLTVVTSDASGSPTGGFRAGTDGSLLTAAGAKALAGVDRASGFGSFGAVRPSIPTGTGLPRAAQFGVRLSF